MKRKPLLIIYFIFISFGLSQKILIPMDLEQSNHLKAYGIAFSELKKGRNIDWLLNYRGGSFLLDYNNLLETQLKLRGVSYAIISSQDLINIFSLIEKNNMDIVLLEKAPKIDSKKVDLSYNYNY